MLDLYRESSMRKNAAKLVGAGIYRIRNLKNGKLYIGSAKNLKVRYRSHRNDLKRQKHHSIILQRAWNKYGENNFIFEVVEEVSNLDNLLKREQHYLDSLSPDYNICTVAGNCTGRKFSKETREKMSKSASGRIVSEEGKRKRSEASKGSGNNFYGKKHTEKTKEKIRIARAKQIITKETKEKLSKRFSGEKNPAAKKVMRIDPKSGNKVIYDYIKQARKDGFKTHAKIKACCEGKIKTYKGYVWKFV